MTRSDAESVTTARHRRAGKLGPAPRDLAEVEQADPTRLALMTRGQVDELPTEAREHRRERLRTDTTTRWGIRDIAAYCYVQEGTVSSKWRNRQLAGHQVNGLTTVLPPPLDPKPKPQPVNATGDLPLLTRAIELVLTNQTGSATMLQRELHISAGVAGRLLDFMAARGIVGPRQKSKARDVLLDLDQLASTGSLADTFARWAQEDGAPVLPARRRSGRPSPQWPMSLIVTVWAPQMQICDFVDYVAHPKGRKPKGRTPDAEKATLTLRQRRPRTTPAEQMEAVA